MRTDGIILQVRLSGEDLEEQPTATSTPLKEDRPPACVVAVSPKDPGHYAQVLSSFKLV